MEEDSSEDPMFDYGLSLIPGVMDYDGYVGVLV